MIVNLRAGLQDPVNRLRVAEEIRRQDLHGGASPFPYRDDAAVEMVGPPVG